MMFGDRELWLPTRVLKYLKILGCPSEYLVGMTCLYMITSYLTRIDKMLQGEKMNLKEAVLFHSFHT